MERLGTLATVITQNIDGLHLKAGSHNAIEYHGNASKLRCIKCGSRYSRIDYVDEISSKSAVRCKKCGAIVKSDIVNFGEPIPSDILDLSISEIKRSDLILVYGTSACVYPFAALPSIARKIKGNGVKIIEINIEKTTLTKEGISDYIILEKTGYALENILNKLEEKI